MKKKILIGGIIVSSCLVIGVSYKFLVSENKSESVVTERKEYVENPLEILGSNNIVFTVNGESTNLSYSELMSEKEINKITCQNGTKAEWDSSNNSITLKEIKMPAYCTIDFKDKPKTLYSQILTDHPSRGTDRPNAFTEVYTEENIKTLYTTTKTESGNTSYYFAGNALDNWVYFAGIYWRIIRINEDNSVRLLYVGPDKDTTAGYIGTSSYNSTYNGPRYVGYMYGSSTGSLANDRGNNTSSTIKGVIDSWYSTNITNKNDGTNAYDKYVSRTAIYCNDRSIGIGTYSTSATFRFGANTRLVDNKAPSYKCGQNASTGLFESTQAVSDKFSGSTTGGGNGKLTYPVALMTADEIVYI